MTVDPATLEPGELRRAMSIAEALISTTELPSGLAVPLSEMLLFVGTTPDALPWNSTLERILLSLNRTLGVAMYWVDMTHATVDLLGVVVDATMRVDREVDLMRMHWSVAGRVVLIEAGRILQEKLFTTLVAAVCAEVGVSHLRRCFEALGGTFADAIQGKVPRVPTAEGEVEGPPIRLPFLLIGGWKAWVFGAVSQWQLTGTVREHFFSKLWTTRGYNRLSARVTGLAWRTVSRLSGGRIGAGEYEYEELMSERRREAMSAYRSSIVNHTARTVLLRNAIDYGSALFFDELQWVVSHVRSPWHLRRRAARFHFASTTGALLEVGMGLTARVAGAMAGVWLAQKMKLDPAMGGFWGEHALYFACTRPITFAVGTICGHLHDFMCDKFPETDAELEAEAQAAAEEADREAQAHAESAAKAEEAQESAEHAEPKENDFANHDRDEVMTKEDYYAALGVEKSATTGEIKKAYRSKALKLHPDRTSHLPPQEREQAAATFKLLSAAYNVLGDDHKRAAYDRFNSGDVASHVFRATGGGMSNNRFANGVSKVATKIATAPPPVRVAVAGTTIVSCFGLGVVVAQGQMYSLFRTFSSTGRGSML